MKIISISIIFCYISIINIFSSLYYQSFFYIFRSSGPKPLKFGLYQDSGRSWINHNGGEIIFDLDKHIVPGTWNTFCYNCDPNGTFQIFANGYTLRNDKYTQSMEHFDLQSPILLGGNSESDAEKHRFFGEISDFNIWSGKLEDNLDVQKRKAIVEWKSVNITFDRFQKHIRVTKETVKNKNQKEKIWVSKDVKEFDAGFLDCENLGGKEVFSYDIDVLKEWDTNGVCDYFWLPVVYKSGSWSFRNANEELFQVLLLVIDSYFLKE